MDFPNFNDFAENEWKELLANMVQNETRTEVFQISDISDPKNIGALIGKIESDILSRATALSFVMLRTYHEWLARSFDRQD